MTSVGALFGVNANQSAETMKEVIKFEAELAKVKFIRYNCVQSTIFSQFKGQFQTNILKTKRTQ